MIKAVIFDIDNTLYDYDNSHATAMKALYQYTNAHFGWSEEETSAALKTERSCGTAPANTVTIPIQEVPEHERVYQRVHERERRA